MAQLNTLYDYLRAYAPELGRRIVETYPPLHAPGDPVAPELSKLLREPIPAQTLAIMGVVKYLEGHNAAKIIGECGTGKTYMGTAATYALAGMRPYTTIVMCPPHLVKKWAREVLITIPNARTYIIEDLRNGGDKNAHHGVCEVHLSGGRILHKGLQSSLPEMRLMGRSAWLKAHPYPCYFIVGREKGKLGYFWKHVYQRASKANKTHCGGVVNVDTNAPVAKSTNGWLIDEDFDERRKHFEIVERDRSGTKMYSPMWSADRSKIQRMAPMEYIGRYMKKWFDFAMADEVHQLTGDTAQGNCLAVLERAASKIITLTGTACGGFADDVWGHLTRIDGPALAREGFEISGAGREAFQRKYGVIETVEKVEENSNACSRNAKKSVQIIRKPGCSPMLFGTHLLGSAAFVSLEDLGSELPPYSEFVLEVDPDPDLRAAYDDLQEQIKATIKQFPKDKGLRSIMLNSLLAFPDHPFDWETIYRRMYDKKRKEYVTVKVAEPTNLSKNVIYSKEKALVEDIRAELAEGRKCQVFCTFTGKHDVVARVERILRDAGMRVSVLRPSVKTDAREEWYQRQLKQGVDVVVCHPKLVETGLDLLLFPTLIFFESGYSTYTLRQASRRSWRIGQLKDVRVKFFGYTETMQSKCLRHMGRKVLVSMMMEGKFSGEGIATIEEDTDMLSSLARELVEEGRVGESADDVWKQINQQRQKLFAPTVETTAPDEEEPIFESAPVPSVDQVLAVVPIAEESVAVPESSRPTVVSMHDFLTAVPSPKRRKGARSTEDAGQLSLFAA